MDKYKVGIIGVGFVGEALKKYFEKKLNYELFLYDKFKKVGSLEEINKADFVYICVPTPTLEDGGCDTSIVEEAIGYIEGEKVIIIRSTVIPGTTEIMQDKYPNHKIIFNPEFLTEETADQDLEYPDRQIVGYTDKSLRGCKDIMLQMPLAPFEKVYPATETEMVKYMTNAWFAMKVAFANQIYDLCEKIGIEYKTVLEGVAADKRVGRTHLKIWHKGYRGYGGKCIPKDTKALLAFAKSLNVDIWTLEATNLYNDILVRNQGLEPLDTDKGKDRKDGEVSYSNTKEIRPKKDAR